MLLSVAKLMRSLCVQLAADLQQQASSLKAALEHERGLHQEVSRLRSTHVL